MNIFFFNEEPHRIPSPVWAQDFANDDYDPNLRMSPSIFNDSGEHDIDKCHCDDHCEDYDEKDRDDDHGEDHDQDRDDEDHNEDHDEDNEDDEDDDDHDEDHDEDQDTPSSSEPTSPESDTMLFEPSSENAAVVAVESQY